MAIKQKTRVYQNTAVRRAQIADAAGRLIVRYGSEHITVRRIADEIGITEGAIYRHFKSKRDILFLMTDMAEDNLLEDLSNLDMENAQSLDILHDAYQRTVRRIVSRKGFYFQLIAEIISFGDKKLNDKAFGFIVKYTSRIKDIIKAGVQSDELEKNLDADTAATMYFSMIQGLVYIWTLSNYSFKLETKAEAFWRQYLRSITP